MDDRVLELLTDITIALKKFIYAMEKEEAAVEEPIIEEPVIETPTEPVEEPVETPVEGAEPAPVEGAETNLKDIDVIAGEVLEGKWGSGDKRKENLEAAGYDYSAVQNRVNQILTIVQEVLDGKWGNGDVRKQKLEAAGYNYEVIQNEINRQLEKKTIVDQLLSACKAQADWMKNSRYAWESNPTIAKSKYKGTCVTYEGCVLQRIGILPSGSYVWHDGGKVYGNNSKMQVIYPGNKTLHQIKSQLKAGDIIIDGDKNDNGSGSHIFTLTGQWSGDNPIIWDNHSAQDKGGKSYVYTRNRPVIAIIRLK